MRRIGIVSAARGAGGRFFAANFACFLAEEGRRPAVLELGAPGLYDVLGMDKRFAGRAFCPQGGPPNIAAGVNWSLLAPDAVQPSPEGGLERFYERLRLIDRVEGDVVLCLLTGLMERERDLFLRDMDTTFLVIDPLPSRLLSAADPVKLIRDEEKRVSPLVNKMNGGVKRHELASFLGVRSAPEIPLVPAEEIYRAEYACRAPYEAKPVADLLRPAFRRILRGM